MSTPEINIPRHRLTIAEYYRMAELGILAPDARVELIEGEIIDMAPQGSRHAHTVALLMRRLVLAVGTAAEVRCQLPIQLSNRSEPEPDFTIVKARGSHYATAHPIGEDVLLVVEVSNTTVSYDRFIKIPLYARHGVPEVWLIDLKAHRVHFFAEPGNDEYAKVSATDRPGIARVASLPATDIDLSGIF